MQKHITEISQRLQVTVPQVAVQRLLRFRETRCSQKPEQVEEGKTGRKCLLMRVPLLVEWPFAFGS